MIKVYGMPTCPNCVYAHSQMTGRENEFEFIDIGSHVKLLKEFLAIRDNSPLFDEIKKEGRAGIPCFVKEDGTITFDLAEVGLKPEPVQGAACTLDGKNC